MKRLAVALCAAAALAAPAAMAVDLCDGPCAVSMDFPAGGSITATDSATLTFASEGALLLLGEGGAVTPGEGGSTGYLEGGPADMSQGGTINLGPGGAIRFGPGGSLATGAGGSIVAQGPLQVDSAKAVVIDSPQNVHLGDLASDGDIAMSSGGDIEGCDASNPVPVAMIVDDPQTTLAVTAAGEISMGSFSGNPTVDIRSDGGNITLCIAEGGFQPDEGSGGSGEGSGGIVVDSGGGSTSCTGCDANLVVVDPIGPAVEAREGDSGGLGASLLLVLGFGAWMRRRR
jgi:fibronectin-binding autotransporter adhesin